MGQSRPLFRLFSVFSKKINFNTNMCCEKMAIQYTVPGFEPTTFGTWVSSHNHWTRAPSQDFNSSIALQLRIPLESFHVIFSFRSFAKWREENLSDTSIVIIVKRRRRSSTTSKFNKDFFWNSKESILKQFYSFKNGSFAASFSFSFACVVISTQF